MPPQLDVQEREDGVPIKVRAAPGASRDRLMGLLGDAVKVAVTVAPEKGKANKAILILLAEALSVPPGDLEVIAGNTSRDKRVLVRGMDAATLRERLQ